MFTYCSTAWSNFLEWKEESTEHISVWLEDHQWTYYIQGRAVAKGLPFAVANAAIGAYLFNCAPSSAGAVFGAVNYLTLTSLTEILRVHHKFDEIKALALIGISGTISLAFMQTVYKTTMTYQTAAILTVAALAGQLARDILINENYF